MPNGISIAWPWPGAAERCSRRPEEGQRSSSRGCSQRPHPSLRGIDLRGYSGGPTQSARVTDHRRLLPDHVPPTGLNDTPPREIGWGCIYPTSPERQIGSQQSTLLLATHTTAINSCVSPYYIMWLGEWLNIHGYYFHDISFQYQRFATSKTRYV